MSTYGMKPEWKDAPWWANYKAQDANGIWYWYESHPKPMCHVWHFVAGLCHDNKEAAIAHAKALASC